MWTCVCVHLLFDISCSAPCQAKYKNEFELHKENSSWICPSCGNKSMFLSEPYNNSLLNSTKYPPHINFLLNYILDMELNIL